MASNENGAATWRLITNAIGQLANNTPPGPVWRSLGDNPEGSLRSRGATAATGPQRATSLKPD
jgi:hypothetical protein